MLGYKEIILIGNVHINGGSKGSMTGEERRNGILYTLQAAGAPVSGALLAKKYQVSRQVIVQDIALLRAANGSIYSTSRGYCLGSGAVSHAKGSQPEGTVRRVFHVSHTDGQIEDELYAIVDMGGKVLDVFIDHEVYGSLRAALPVSCRRHVQEFMESIRSGKSSPLKNLTSGAHYHTVEADSEETLDYIEQELEKRGYLL